MKSVVLHVTNKKNLGCLISWPVMDDERMIGIYHICDSHFIIVIQIMIASEKFSKMTLTATLGNPCFISNRWSHLRKKFRRNHDLDYPNEVTTYLSLAMWSMRQVSTRDQRTCMSLYCTVRSSKMKKKTYVSKLVLIVLKPIIFWIKRMDI